MNLRSIITTTTILFVANDQKIITIEAFSTPNRRHHHHHHYHHNHNDHFGIAPRTTCAGEIATTAKSILRATSASSSSSCCRINQKIDLDSPKVVTADKLFERSGENKKVYCRCWKSNTFPLCDGAHVVYNKETGDNVGPLIVSAAVASAATTTTTAAAAMEETKGSEENEPAANPTMTTTTNGFATKLKSIISFRNKKQGDTRADAGGGGGGLTTRERLAKMGLSALLSYGWVSNMSYAVTLSLSWYLFSKKVSEPAAVAAAIDRTTRAQYFPSAVRYFLVWHENISILRRDDYHTDAFLF